MTKFYDTNILLSHLDAVKKEDLFLLSSVTLREMEHIKVGTKSDEVKYEARRATRFLDENPDKYKVVVYDLNSQCDFNEYGLEDSPDNRIMRCAVYARDVLGYSDLVFMTNDILCKLIAKEYFKLNVESISSEHHEIYDGYKDISNKYHFNIREMEVDKDHIHMTIESEPMDIMFLLLEKLVVRR